MIAVSARERYLRFRRSIPHAPRLEERRVVARGLEFAVYSTPPVVDAPPLLCINGGLLFDHSLLWPALAPLAHGRQLVFYDQRGRGKSRAPADPSATRITHDAADVPALREALGFRRWDLLGHSWGGGIAALAADRDRAGTRALVLVNAVGPNDDWLDGLHAAATARLAPQHRAVLQHLDPRSLLLANPDAQSAYAAALQPAWFADADLARMFGLPRGASHTGSAVAAALRREGYDWTVQIRAVVAHTLVIHGERDLLPVRFAGALAALISRARLEVIPDCGHMPFWEAPETFFAHLEDFFRSLNRQPLS